jgi:predicted phosphate transport protein (TIGR00153 family)
MLRWFQAIMPREERFFDLFARHAQTLSAGAEALRGVLQGGEEIAHYCQIVSEREHEADEITREVLEAVRRTFITPFDRSDIQGLISSMDDAIDQMHKTAKTITLFELHSFEPPMREMGDIIVESAKLVGEAMPLLRAVGKHATRLIGIAEQVVRIEDKADHIHERGRKELFLAHRGGGDALAYMVGNEVYDHLEKVMDRLEDVANKISAIVIEHV